MKIWLSFDFEGVAGIVDWAQCDRENYFYQQGCELVLGEVNAAIEGALAAGATEFVVNDSHGRMFNLDPRKLAGNAHYLSGAHKPMYMMEGLDNSADGIFWIGYHGAISGPPATLSHTYNPGVFTASYVNGDEVGEGGINALVAQHLDVPIVLVAGDQRCEEQNRPFASDAEFVVTKRSITRFAAENLHPDESRQHIYDAALHVVSRLASGEAFANPGISSPVQLDLDVWTSDMAELATWVRGCERVSERRVRIETDNLLQAYQRYVAVNYITRQAGGR